MTPIFTSLCCCACACGTAKAHAKAAAASVRTTADRRSIASPLFWRSEYRSQAYLSPTTATRVFACPTGAPGGCGRIGSREGQIMRVGIIGGGTIARLLLHHIRTGEIGEGEVVAIVGR